MILGYNVIQWENGLSGLGRSERIFFGNFSSIAEQKTKKNPFGSARSAQSVLPLYHKTIRRTVYLRPASCGVIG
jgi:hypothetical protein